jgi:hypothetical protein
MEPSICSRVYFTGIDNAHCLLTLLKDRGCDRTLFNRAITPLGVGQVHYDLPPPALTTTLNSGSYPFLQKVAAETRSGRTLLVLDKPWRGKTPRPVNQVSWQRLRPTQFGGSTCYPVLMGFSSFPFDPKGSSLGRTIGHVLDHGIRPTFLSSFVAASLDSRQQEFYGSDSLLDLRYLDRPVAYQITYSSSRWGSRVLTTDEIGIACPLE